ncbi:MAG: thiamine phosphate synthase [Acidobacteria bacterium]|nr:MAG: thiamine phosphate synthase [Acidobacteriota bacterium]GIK78578.1 MAG: thiamine-phosphate synthase [Actinomycetes bacterium]
MARPTARLERSRLYLVTGAGEDPAALERLLDAALAGGVDMVQLRDKDADDERLLAAAPAFRAAADRHGALFLINDRPDLVTACAADGVHVGQDDAPVAAARRLAGPDALVGLSTHSPGQLREAGRATGDRRPDYISVGPVWETPTKPGRPAAGLGYVELAAAEAELPWFAIGGIEPDNLAAVVAAGATRIVVVRAIRDADDPGAIAAVLADGLGTGRSR